MKWGFRILSAIVVIALAVAIAIVLKPQPLDVEVAKVTRAPLDQKVVNDGRARVRERYTVSSPVAGTLARIELHEGDIVEPGQIVARLLPLASPLLDPESRKAAEQRVGSAVDASAQAQSTTSRAQIASDAAHKDLGRVEALAKEGVVSGAELDRATAEANMRDAELSSAKFAARIASHEIALTRAALARFDPGTGGKSEEFQVTSPVHGQVLHVLHRSEGVVGPGTALLEIGDPAALELVADVLSEDAVALKPGMTARVIHYGGEEALSAKVRLVEPAAFTKTSALGVDEQRVNVVLDLGPEPASRGLGDGFSVEVEITVWSRPDVLQLPTSALFRVGDQWSVYVVADGRAKTRKVEPGHRGPLVTEILSGVDADETVVIHPGAAIRDGARVTFR